MTANDEPLDSEEPEPLDSVAVELDSVAPLEDDSVGLEEDCSPLVPLEEDCVPLEEDLVPLDDDLVPLDEDRTALACLRRSAAVVAVLDVAVPRLESAGSWPEASCT